jgi:hypothetical protein
MVIVRAMTRIPYVRREELGPEGQQLWDSIVNGRAQGCRADRTVTRMRVICESRRVVTMFNMDMDAISDRLRYLLRLDGRATLRWPP